MTGHFLPTIFADRAADVADASGVCWRLPLAESTARTLLAILSAGDADGEKRDCAARVLRNDPALLLWTVCRAGLSEQPPPLSIAAAADWLARDDWHVVDGSGDAVRFAGHGDEVLAATSDDKAEHEIASRDLLARFAERTRRTQWVVQAVGRLTEGSTEPVREAAEFLALLSFARQWLDDACRSCPTVDDNEHVDAQATALPAGCGWVVALLEDDAAETGETFREAARHVREARRQIDVGEIDGDGADEKRLRQAVEQLWREEDDFARRLLPRLAAQRDRLTRLETSFDEELEQAKVASLAEFAAGAGHEINNPLAVISARAQLLMREETHPRRRRELAVIHAQALRVTEMISDMMLFARPPEPEWAMHDLAERGAHWSDDWHAWSREAGVALEVALGESPLWVRADDVQLRVAVGAVIRNALEAAGEAGKVRVEMSFGQRGEAPTVAIEVGDDGPGMSDDVRQHLFDPFYSGREAGRGIGMGMSKCWRIVQLHAGEIEVRATAGGGTVVRIVLPMAEAGTRPARRSA